MWMVGCVDERELAGLEKLFGKEDLTILSKEQEVGLWGWERDADDTDQMVMVWLDSDLAYVVNQFIQSTKGF